MVGSPARFRGWGVLEVAGLLGSQSEPVVVVISPRLGKTGLSLRWGLGWGYIGSERSGLGVNRRLGLLLGLWLELRLGSGLGLGVPCAVGVGPALELRLMARLGLGFGATLGTGGGLSVYRSGVRAGFGPGADRAGAGVGTGCGEGLGAPGSSSRWASMERTSSSRSQISMRVSSRTKATFDSRSCSARLLGL